MSKDKQETQQENSAKKKIALVLGISGQDGSYLAELLLEKGYEVHGVIRRASDFNTRRIDHLFDAKSKSNIHFGVLAQGIDGLLYSIKPDEVYNLAAMSQVRVSFDVPVYTADINAVGVTRLLEAIKRGVDNGILSKDIKFYQASSCYDEKTRLVTKEGLKYFNEIKGNDIVYTMNPTTKQIEEKSIDKIIISDYQGEMFSFGGSRMDISVTPNHRVYFQKDNGNKLSWDFAYNMKNYLKRDRYSNISVPIAKPFKGKKPKYINFYDYFDKSNLPCNAKKNLITKMETKDFLYILGLYIGDGFTDVTKKTMRSMNKHKLMLQSRTKEGYFKSFPKNEKVTYKGHRLGFALPKDTEPRKKLLKILDKYNVQYDTENKISVFFTSYILAEVLKLAGKNVYHKRIPEEFINFDASLLKYLFEGLIDSDGHEKYTLNGYLKHSYTTVSKQLAKDIVVLAYKLGIIPRMTTRKAQKVYYEKEKRTINARESYIITFTNKKSNKFYKHNIKTSEYKGKVWCLNVKNNNFLVERNGVFCFSGNSEMFGQTPTPVNGYTESSAFTPVSPYGCAKLYGFWITKSYRTGYNLFACNGVLFNHESQRRGPTFVTRKITIAACKIKLGLQKELVLGNLNALRDWGHSKDYVRAIHAIMQHDKPEDFIVATGNQYTVKDFVIKVFEYLGMDWKDYVKYDSVYERPNEVPNLLGDATKITTTLNWKPEYDFEALIKDMVDSDMENIKKELK